MIDEQLSKLLGSIPPIFYNESGNMEDSRSGRCKFPKRGKIILDGTKCVNGWHECGFCAYPRTSPQQNAINKICKNATKRMVVLWLKAYGENGIKGGAIHVDAISHVLHNKCNSPSVTKTAKSSIRQAT